MNTITFREVLLVELVVVGKCEKMQLKCFGSTFFKKKNMFLNFKIRLVSLHDFCLCIALFRCISDGFFFQFVNI